MSDDLKNKLARLQNRTTRYELAATRGDEKLLIVYTARRTRSGLLAGCRGQGERLVKLPGGAEAITFAHLAKDGAKCGEWSIRFTGRTQRDAYMEGELKFIGDLPA